MKLSRAPRQERSAQSLVRLLDAAERLMQQQHFEDISVAQIAGEAGTSIGNFYGRFNSKDDLLLILHERYQDDRLKLWREFFDGADWTEMRLADRALPLIRMIIRNYRARSGVFRTLVLQQWRYPEKVDARTREVLGGLYKDGFEFLRECRREIRHPKPERAIEIGIAAVLAACRENIVMRPKVLPASLMVSDEELAVELSHMLCAYLTAPPAAARGSTRR
jgi:AcrR family transcriptional regulator